MMKKLNKVQLAFLFVALLFPCALFAQPLKGTYAIGDTGAYTSITQAINDLRIKGVDSAVVFELQGNYTDANEVFPIRIPLITGVSESNTITIRPAATAGLLTINSVTQKVFEFDSAKYVIIDGRAGGTGTSRMLHLRNTGIANAAITFQNDACFNKLIYDSITVDSAAAIDFLATNVLVRGNDSNMISWNSISSRINKTRYLVHSSGSVFLNTVSNSENLIKGNLFTGFGQIANDDTTKGIYLETGNSGWVIEENSFFQPTEILSNTTLNFVGIHLNVGPMASAMIRNNFIGGSSALCKGQPFKMRATTLSRPLGCYGIYVVSRTSDDPFIISGNEISNFSLVSSNTNYFFTGIYRSVSNNGNSYTEISNNKIGSTDSTRSITITNTLANTTGTINGIFVSMFAGGNTYLTASGNNIGGIASFVPSATASKSNFRGISVAGLYTDANVSDNVIGNANARNIFMERAYECSGIVVTNNTQVSSNTISDNVVRNIHLDKPFTNINGNSAAGIAANCPDPSSLKVNRNMIYSLSSRAFGTTSSPVYSLSGIYLTGGALAEVAQNQVYHLYNDSIKGHTPIYGMRISAVTPTSKPVIYANVVRDLYSLNPSFPIPVGDSAIVYGIVSMNTNCINNVVRLGYDTSGNPVRSSTRFSGIVEVASSNSITAHNSVYIGGDSAYPMVSYAYYTINAAAGSTVANNIFVNTRSTVNTNKTYHYALGVVTKPGLKSRNNLFYVSGKSSATAQYRDSVYIDLATVSRNLNDSGSAFGNPNFINPTGKDTACNLRLASPTPAEGSGIALAAVTFDADSNLRADLTPTDLGAYADTLTYTEAIPPTISFTPLTNTAFLTDRTLYAMISDSSGILTNDSLKPRVYFRKGINGTWQYNGGTIDSGNVYSAKWSFVLPDPLVGGFAANDTIYYFIVAQDSSLLHNMAGAIGPDVRTINSAPVYLNSYRILPAFSGTYNVGAGQTFTSLTNTNGFFQKLSQGIATGDITLLIAGNLTESGTYPLSKWVNEANGKYKIVIGPDSAVRRTISSNTASAIITISGAEGVTINGNFNNSGRYLVFRHTGNSGRVFSLTSGCRKDTIQNCIIEGRNTSTAVGTRGLINIQSGPSAAGSVDSVVMMNNLIRKDTTGSVYPNYGIALGYVGSNVQSSDVHIIDNEFADFRYAAIYTEANPNITAKDWYVFGNNFYQPTTFSAPASLESHNPVYFGRVSGLIIRKNSFGGRAANRNGLPLTMPARVMYLGIVIPSGSTGNILIDSNEMGNINVERFYGLDLNSSAIANANKIGYGLMEQDSIKATLEVRGISIAGPLPATTYEVTNNKIGNMLIAGTGTGGGNSSAISLFNASADIHHNEIINMRSHDHTSHVMYTISAASDPGAGTRANIHHNLIDSINTVNEVVSSQTFGIHVRTTNYANVSHNTIKRLEGDIANAIDYAYTDTMVINNNQIFLPSRGTAYASGYFTGIRTDDPNSYAFHRIYNNTIYTSGFSNSNHPTYGIFAETLVAKMFNNLIYNKTINVNSSSAAVGINVTGGKNIPEVLAYNLMLVNDSTKAYKAGSFEYGSNQTVNFLSALGQTNTNWIERTDRLPAHLLFEDTIMGDLDIRTNNNACWYVNGKGIALADVSDDMHGDVRSTSISGGTTDIGADEFTPDGNVLPHEVRLSLMPASDSAFVFAGRVIGQVHWNVNTVYPTPDVSLRYYSGLPAPSLIPGTDHFNAYHDLTLTGGSTHSYSMWALFDSSCMGTVANKNDIRMAVNQGSWMYAEGGIVSSYPLYTHSLATNYTGSALFTGTTATNPLPVKLLAFSGIKQNKDVVLNWKTASEINTDVFVVERSYNGKIYEAIGEVKAKGNTSSTTSYQFTDQNVRADQTIYYRLNIKDHNGYAEHSKTVIIETQQTATSIQVYPNPSASNFFVQVNSTKSATAKIVLYDMTGRVVQTMETLVNKGLQDIEISTSHLQAGIYFVTTELNGEKQTIKVLKQ